MNILVIGTGGREHTLVWKISRSPKADKIYCPGGNAGISKLADVSPVDSGENFQGLIDFAREKEIGLTVVGPEAPLAEGIVDAFEKAGLKIFGPSREGARIESSKYFAKEIMLSSKVLTGSAQTFTDSAEAIKFLGTTNFPVVVKADGLAAGKGVIIVQNRDEAEESIRDILDNKKFGGAGSRILIEEFLTGEEASLLAFTDGETVLSMVSAQDHKPVGEGDAGPNTGGMGAYSPAPVVTDELYRKCVDEILKPTVEELKKRGIKYKGVLYAGLMITEAGPKILEFNCRFGDPETQALLPRLKTDLVDVMEAVAEERLSEIELEWNPDPAVCVVMASGGYPGKYEKGKTIEGIKNAEEKAGCIVFHAGTRFEEDRIVTSGGRVLGVTALGKNLPEAIDKAYSGVKEIRFDDMYYRKDIAQKALKRMKS